MSRCARTDAILEATFSGAGLSTNEADHAAVCAECARALAGARRFDRELHLVGSELVPEPMPPGTVTATHGATIREGAPMSRRIAIIAGVAAAALAAVLVGTVEWGGSDSGAARPGPASDTEVTVWAQSALAFVTRAEPDGGEAAGWEPVRVERCGRTALAFFEATATDGLPLYRWAMGSVDVHVPRSSGQVRSVDDANVAGLRATLPPCETVVDVVAAPLRDIGRPHELWTVMTGDEHVDGEVRIVGATLMADGHRRGPLGGMEVPTYLVLMDRRTDHTHLVERATISVTDGAWAAGRFVDLPVDGPGTLRSMQVFADPGFSDETLFAWIDDPDVRAVDIRIPREGRVLRYTVGPPGFVLQFEARVGPVEEMTYELLDGDGAILEAGSVAAWLDRLPRN
jgi:hypothetical protein